MAIIVTLIVVTAINLVFVVILLVLVDDLNQKVKSFIDKPVDKPVDEDCQTQTGASESAAGDEDAPVGEDHTQPIDGESAADNVDTPAIVHVPQEIYEKSVYRFIELMRRIETEKKQSELQRLAFRYLADIDTDMGVMLQAVKNNVTDIDAKGKFNTLANDIKMFMDNERPIIDSYLAALNYDGVASYREAISMPEGEAFSPALHFDILDEANVGDPIVRVLSLGYFFPKSTTAPYLERPKVVC